jgi:hypothetical protein
MLDWPTTREIAALDRERNEDARAPLRLLRYRVVGELIVATDEQHCDEIGPNRTVNA